MKKKYSVLLEKKKNIEKLISKYKRMTKKQMIKTDLEFKFGKEYLGERNIYLVKEKGNSEKISIPCTKIDLEIEASEEFVKGKDYDILAKLDHSYPGDSNMVTIYNSNLLPYSLEQLKKIEAKCEHCNTKRLRNVTFLVYDSENKKIKQIAKNCLKEYTGYMNIFKELEFREEFEETIKECNESYPICSSEVGEYKYVIPTLLALKTIEKVIKENGYISKKEAYYVGSKSTADIVALEILNQEINEEETEKYKNLVKEFLNIDKEQYSDNYEKNDTCFMFKMEKILSYEYVTQKELGILACFFFALNKLKKNISNENVVTKYNNLNYKEKEKIDIEAKFENVAIYPSSYSYGTVSYYYFENNNINFRWKTSSYSEDLKKGEKVRIKATVKKINIEKLIVEIIRCKIIREDKIKEEK